MNHREKLQYMLAASRGDRLAEIVYKNGTVLNVYTSELLLADIAVEDGVIVGVGRYDGVKEVDLTGKTVVPGLIDGHVHIESSMTTPRHFAEVLVRHGVTTIVCDPHEIANVKGVTGIEYMIESSQGLPVDIRFMLPSCVPSSGYETSGAVLKAEDLAPLYAKERVLGLGELMDFPGAISGNDDVMDKVLGAQGRVIDGHGPELVNAELNAYAFLGVGTEHECTTPEEMQDRLRLGMVIQIREGSATKNLDALIGSVTPQNSGQCIFCTDDRDPKDLIEEGSIDNNIRKAIALGCDPVEAVRLATINPARVYGLRDKGAIAPGKEATFVVLEDLEAFVIDKVVVKGVLEVDGGKNLRSYAGEEDLSKVGRAVAIPDIKVEDLAIPILSERANVIGLMPHNVTTEHLVMKVGEVGEDFIADETFSKVIVVERHHATGAYGLGILKGYGIRGGAIAQTIAHDSHNLICVGDDDEDMMIAIEALEAMGGGQVVVARGEIKGKLELPVAGLMSKEPVEAVAKAQEVLFDTARRELHIPDEVEPFMTLGFMSLPVIPAIKLTDLGLFDVVNQVQVPLFQV